MSKLLQERECPKIPAENLPAMFSRTLLRESGIATSATSSNIDVDYDYDSSQNRHCQKSDWSSHKKVCKLHAEFRELIKASSSKAALDSTGQIFDLKPVESRLKQWIRVRKCLLAPGHILHLTAYLPGVSAAVGLCPRECADPKDNP